MPDTACAAQVMQNRLGVQGRGDHEIWRSPISERYFVVDRLVKSKHTANETLKQAGFEKAF